MMTLYSYIVKHDYGFAPNPFHGLCTLACCKPSIRGTAKEGDYIVGIGKKSLGNRAVYAMQVKEIVEFEEYWQEERFRVKRPDWEAGGEKAVGDNIYHRGQNGAWIQERSLHSLENGEQDWKQTHKDTTRTEKVLIGEDFIYWGGDGPPLPENLQGLIVGRAHKSSANDKYIPHFIRWFEGQDERGRLELPTTPLSPTKTTGSQSRRRC